ncbi:MAG: hypothetical protein EZS28_009304 [Streblomastix strix]|uniref:Uncharacterized protein n=1 Tax=Streblomastix strix TaxID=222440 RepID=A0A5J4WLG6_9EUKA|nr:MAG: hypothetical protein EZS28_009304 [Streblomastix strix]
MYVTYPSEILKKDHMTVNDCLLNVFQQEPLRSCNLINTWSDGAGVMRSGFITWLLLDSKSPLRRGADIRMNFFCEQHGKNFCDSYFGLISNFLKLKRLSDSINTYQKFLDVISSSFHVQNSNGTPCLNIFIDYSRTDGFAALTRYNLVDQSQFLHFESKGDKLFGKHDSIPNSTLYLLPNPTQSGYVQVAIRLAPKPKPKIKNQNDIFDPIQASKQKKRAKMEKDDEEEEQDQ